MRNLACLFLLPVLLLGTAPAASAQKLQKPSAESIWAFFEALPSSALPDGISTPQQRKDFHKDYEDMLAAQAGEESEFWDGPGEIEFSIFWNPEILGPVVDLEEEPEDPYPSVTFNVFPGSDPNRVFGWLERTLYVPGEGLKKFDPQYFWYSVPGKSVTTATLPLDVPYTDAEITDDGVLLYRQNELYWAMRDRRFDWIIEPERIILVLEGVGMLPVSYDWNGTRFVRNRNYRPGAILYSGLCNIQLEEAVPFDLHGYESNWVDNGEDNVTSWDFVKAGEKTPRFRVSCYGGSSRIGSIEVFSPDYPATLAENIRVGMPVTELMEALKEAYSYMENDIEPVVSTFRDDVVEIYSGQEDNLIFNVDKSQYRNGRFVPGAKVKSITIVHAVG